MLPAPIPPDEQARLDVLYKIGIIDTPPEDRFDNITKAAVARFKVMLSTITIIDKDREWYKSRCGIATPVQGPRNISFCGHALESKDIFIIEDTTKDPRFIDNPYVVGPPFVRFYAGVALHDSLTNQPIGVLCIKDNKTRQFSEQDVADFLALGKKAEKELNSKASSTQVLP